MFVCYADCSLIRSNTVVRWSVRKICAFVDRMQPASLVKPDKKKAVHIGDGDQEEEKSTAARPTASRHLLLIRHGQYVLNSKDDASRHLTELGQWFLLRYT